LWRRGNHSDHPAHQHSSTGRPSTASLCSGYVVSAAAQL
jgi:hypothetical protein